MRGMILAAGFGTRLWPLTEDRTKPAIPFLNKPLVVYAVEYLRDAGIRSIIVNLHHRPDSVRSVLGDGSEFGVAIRYSHEHEILGTGGALDRVRPLLEDDNFVVVNGKIVTDIDLASAIDAHLSADSIATLVLLENARREHFRIVDVDERRCVTGFDGFPGDEDVRDDPDRPPLMFTGIQVMSPRIFNYVPQGRFSHTTTDVFPPAIEAGELIHAHVATGSWRELSTLARYREESIEASGAPNVLGEGSRVASGATVVDSVLWQDVVVEQGARVERCVVGDGVRISGGETFADSVIVRASIVRDFERGRVEGDRLVAPIEPVLD